VSRQEGGRNFESREKKKKERKPATTSHREFSNEGRSLPIQDCRQGNRAKKNPDSFRATPVTWPRKRVRKKDRALMQLKAQGGKEAFPRGEKGKWGSRGLSRFGRKRVGSFINIKGRKRAKPLFPPGKGEQTTVIAPLFHQA